MILHGDCLSEMRAMEDNSVDSIVTDPPYELGFMGKSWDNTGIANNVEMWKECLRVLKPGGYLLSFSATRTYHRMACAIEDAGFEIRDMIEWVYGSGFPKSLNIGKAVDKMQGNEREVVGIKEQPLMTNHYGKGLHNERPVKELEDTKGTSEWEGWGTALKPAHEPICMARKPLSEKTVAENVLKHGTGGINIEESKVGTETTRTTIKDLSQAHGNQFGKAGITYPTQGYKENTPGRFPANLIHDGSDEVRECFPESTSGAVSAGKYKQKGWKNTSEFNTGSSVASSGNASRFFKSIIYQAKASKSERNKGCEGLEEKAITEAKGNGLGRVCDICGTSQLKPCECENNTWILPVKNKNNHPTVKPIALMEYLINMVTPKGGTVLDPFMGSGSTGIACKKEGFEFIGIELDEDYFKIAKARIEKLEHQHELFKGEIK